MVRNFRTLDHPATQRSTWDQPTWTAPRAYGERPVPDEGAREIGAARDYPRYEITEYSSAR